MKDNDPIQITVVIVNYNGGDHIINCLTALANQRLLPCRTIVVDNNSQDGSVQKIENQFSNVEVVRLNANTGFAAANNRAFDLLIDDQWVALLNPDTIPSSSWLDSLNQSISRYPNIDVFSSKLIDANDDSRIDGAGDVFHVSGLSWRRHHGLSVSAEIDDHDPVFSPCAAAAVYRLDKIKEVGGFDESYFCYNEDVDLMFRMRLNGAKGMYVDSSVVAHVGSGITGKNSDFSVYHGHRNLVWTYIKNMPGWRFYWYLPQHLVLNMITIIFYSLTGRMSVILKSKWDAVKGLGAALEKRKTIQRNKKVEDSEVVSHMCKGIFRQYFSRFK